jgi:putative phage-type endonuclease
MTMPLIEVEQGSQEWLAARAGMITASHLVDVLATVKSGEAASVKKYRARIVQERATGAPMDEGFTSKAMMHGTETEPIARDEYELVTGNEVEQTGFWIAETMPYFGASPDGLVGDDGLVEIKCPETHTHLETWRTKKIPHPYKLQILGNLIATDRQWAVFVSFDNRVRWQKLWLYQQRITREELMKEFPDTLVRIREFEQTVQSELGYFEQLAKEMA